MAKNLVSSNLALGNMLFFGEEQLKKHPVCIHQIQDHQSKKHKKNLKIWYNLFCEIVTDWIRSAKFFPCSVSYKIETDQSALRQRQKIWKVDSIILGHPQ